MLNAPKKANFNFTALMLGARNGHSDIVKIVIPARADVLMANDNEWTAPHFAEILFSGGLIYNKNFNCLLNS